MRKFIAILSVFAITYTSVTFYTAGISETAVATSEQIEDVFYDDFSSGTLDPDR